MAAALEGAALGKAVSALFEIVKDVTGNTLKFGDVLERLESTLGRLKGVVEDIERSHREMGRPDEISALIKQMKKGEDRVKKYSKLQWWKYPMRSHYTSKLCKLEDDLIRFFQLDVTALTYRSVSKTWNVVSDTLARKNLACVGSCAVPEPPDFIVGLDVPLEELKMRLRKEEESMLVLTAPGGCGKTTLVTMLCRDQEIKGKYEGNIFFFTFSKSPNVKVIVQEIFRKKKEQVPQEFSSDEDAISQLKQLLNRMEQKPILLILDDVWSGSESLLDNFAFHIPNYKILVTSRNAFPRFPFRYNLEPLNGKAAMKLFRHSANLKDGNSFIPSEDIVEKIVKDCGGFPLALKVIGRSLCGQSEMVWRSRVMEWSNDHSILASSTSSDLLVCLQKSLDFKDKEIIIKKCFLDLGSFPEDQRIRVAALIDMWSELYELDEDGIQAMANLYEITYRNLASLRVTRNDASEVGIYCSEDYVLQHDLLRELAIHQSSQEPIEQRKRLIVDISENKLPKWWKESRQQPISAQLLSISTDDKFSSSWCNIQASEVEVLVLNFQTKNYTLPKFVEKMDKLKVLIVTNYGYFHAELDNFQLLGSLSYLKKIRLEKVSIASLFKSLVELKSLEKISIFMCNIGQAFRACTIQVSDALRNLKEITIDCCIDLTELPAGLCDIGCLKKLGITDCHKLSALPEEIVKLVNLEVLGLKSCTDLAQLPESITSLNKLSILDISDCLSIRKLPKHIGELHNLKKLHMEGCLRLRNHFPPSTWDLDQLELVTCDEERAKLWEPVKDFLTNLQVEVVGKDNNLNWLPLQDF
ncbi:probable disease resistance protein At5g66900 [Corylus avellana]|uniref:probable disease resistance protein At5g66900 n=1 Tax=Corylus avellana TaxID=13451 RepID=UPI00286A304E|nr:probable disease resistance protein At5g66900 [Corylus avellana]